ncbi:hypothetical protein JTE90_017887 [Oedothorax gibbosus]|uniref:Uncharacterized protein n=1 Tax=Oedothorax gibbosus TaxID=931172 RepID=A0AAV6V439_9ARAC|nr:hypothetical protein JTE90_017887 [Oedothorax gibbosus]
MHTYHTVGSVFKYHRKDNAHGGRCLMTLCCKESIRDDFRLRLTSPRGIGNIFGITFEMHAIVVYFRKKIDESSVVTGHCWIGFNIGQGQWSEVFRKTCLDGLVGLK